MKFDVLIITIISIFFIYPNVCKCIEEKGPDGLDSDEFDFSGDKELYERHKEEVARLNRMKEMRKMNEFPKLTSKYVFRLAIYSLSILFLAKWAHKGYLENRKIATDWYQTITPLLSFCMHMPKDESIPIQSLGYHHFKVGSKGIKNFAYVFAELKLMVRQCFFIHHIKKIVFREYDVFNLSLVFIKMDVFNFTIVNNMNAKDFFDQHYEVKKTAVRHENGDLTHFLETYTNSTGTFDACFPDNLKSDIKYLSHNIRFIHFSDIISANTTPAIEKDTIPDETFKGIKMSFIIPQKSQQDQLINLIISIIKFCCSISLDDCLRRQINDERAQYLVELDKVHREMLKKEMEENKNKANDDSDDDRPNASESNAGRAKNTGKGKARFRFVG